MHIFSLLAACSPLAILIIIIWWHSRSPISLWAIVLNEWQTLAAALIGFSALAITLLVQSGIDRKEIDHKQMKLDWAVISGIRIDLKHLHEEIDFILSELTPTDDQMSKMNTTQCELIIARIRNFEYSPPTMTKILASSGAKLTPTVVPLVTDAMRVQGYVQNFGTVDFFTDCSEAPTETVVRHLAHTLAVMKKVDYMVKFIDKFEEYTLGAPSYSPLETADPEISKKIRQSLCKDREIQLCDVP